MKIKLSPPQILLFGFLSFILIGTLILMLPFATTKGISPLDAIFTATSAVCVTGLIVNDTPVDFTVFGQIVIMFLIQIGGLGYMTSATIISLILGKRIGLSERLIMKEGLNVISLEGIVRFTKSILLVTFVFEFAGMVILFLSFSQNMELKRALFTATFHSISAFNNAGFSLFSDNLVGFRGDLLVNFTITSLIIAGGLGFFVLNDLYKYQWGKIRRISLHSKTVLLTTGLLLVTGTCLVFIFEISNPQTFQKISLKESLLSSYFAAVTARTAGFNTMDYASVRPVTLLLTIMLMFIGASPGSTGGGVKTSTAAVVVMSLLATMRGMRDTLIFNRRIPVELISKSFLLITLSVWLIIFVTLTIIKMENTESLFAIFEVTSAFGTVGLSVGDGSVRSLAAGFGPYGKLLLSLVMLIGRLGPLTFAVAVIKPKQERYRFPEGKVVIG